MTRAGRTVRANFSFCVEACRIERSCWQETRIIFQSSLARFESGARLAQEREPAREVVVRFETPWLQRYRGLERQDGVANRALTALAKKRSVDGRNEDRPARPDLESRRQDHLPAEKLHGGVDNDLFVFAIASPRFLCCQPAPEDAARDRQETQDDADSE